MKLGRVTKLDKTNTTILKKMTPCWQIVMSLSFFQFMVNSERFGSRIRDAWSVKFTFLLIAIFYLTENVNSTKVSLTQLTYYCFE